MNPANPLFPPPNAGSALREQSSSTNRKGCFRPRVCLLLILSACLLPALPVRADSKKKDTEKSKAEKLQADRSRAVTTHLTFLKPYMPHLTPADIKGRSLDGLRRLYYEAFRAQGLSIEESTAKAAAEITPERAREVNINKYSSTSASKEQSEKSVKVHFDYLSVYNPGLTMSDLQKKSIADLRRLYYEAYISQGVSIVNAKRQADELDLQPEKKPKINPPSTPADEPAVVDTNFEYLSPHLPWLKPGDLKNKSDSDLKRLYYEAYRAQGMSMQEATRTADSLIVVTLSAGDDPYSLEAGQIAASSKTTVNSKPSPTPKK